LNTLCGGRTILVAGLVWLWSATAATEAMDGARAALAGEVANHGWIVYCARAENGTWDLFLMRPDGSQRRNISNTPDTEEAAPRFSPDGKRILFRILRKNATINHDRWGFQGTAAICDPDGRNLTVLGKEGTYPWASWSPDGRQLLCLANKGILIADIEKRAAVRELPRKGIFKQLFWSPDGRWFCGVANHQGESWTVVRMDAETGEINRVRQFQNCTPDWSPDSKKIIFSSRPAGQAANDGYGWTQLWVANGDGSEPQLVYGEEGFHIYGGAFSPDGKYILFTKTTTADGGGSEREGGPICLMRTTDAPAIAGESPELRKAHPEAKDATVLVLTNGWEPCWTLAQLGTEPKT
jgi:Tol biopolymer transport system component